EYQTTQKIGAVQIIPLHEISQSLKNIDNVLNEYNKFKVGYNWFLPGTETGYIDSKIVTFVLENKQVIAKCYYDHPLLWYVVDLTNEDLLQNCQSPISRLTN
ncbi:25966_t:CDS:2, partial [Gigaspora margarita]